MKAISSPSLLTTLTSLSLTHLTRAFGCMSLAATACLLSRASLTPSAGLLSAGPAIVCRRKRKRKRSAAGRVEIVLRWESQRKRGIDTQTRVSDCLPNCSPSLSLTLILFLLSLSLPLFSPVPSSFQLMPICASDSRLMCRSLSLFT